MDKTIFRIDTLSNFERFLEAGMSPDLAEVMSNGIFNIIEDRGDIPPFITNTRCL